MSYCCLVNRWWIWARRWSGAKRRVNLWKPSRFCWERRSHCVPPNNLCHRKYVEDMGCSIICWQKKRDRPEEEGGEGKSEGGAFTSAVGVGDKGGRALPTTKKAEWLIERAIFEAGTWPTFHNSNPTRTHSPSISKSKRGLCICRKIQMIVIPTNNCVGKRVHRSRKRGNGGPTSIINERFGS